MTQLRQCCHAFALLIVVGFGSLSFAYAQSSQMLDLEKLTSRTTQGLSQLLTGEQIPTDDIVDPGIYILGPGDILSYMTSGLDFSEKLVVVSPESSVLMERFGVVDVRRKSLSRLRDSLTSVYKSRVPDGELYISLKRARTVYVSLKGSVAYPGTFAVPASMRVSTLLSISRQPWLLYGKKLQMETGATINESTVESTITKSINPLHSGYSIRNITIRHREGTDLVDLAKSRLPGLGQFDPHLREGDVITVPFEPDSYPTITITGAVASPASLEYKPGDRASVLLSAAGGISSDGDVNSITLVHSGGEGRIRLTVDSAFHIIGEDPELLPGSTVIVEKIAKTGGDAKQGVVEVYGEVRNPGSIIIKPDVTKLSEVIERCGGVNEKASLSLSYVVRPDRTVYSERVRLEEAKRNFMYSDLILDDTVRYMLDQSYRLPYVSCDVKQALQDTSSDDNLVLHSGDIIVIATNPRQVFVYGQVNQPGYIEFQPKQNLEWYVEQAGGFATGAKSGRARIIKGRTKVWLDDTDAFVEPGDEVYVPRAPHQPAGLDVQTYAVIAGIISSIAALTATVITLTSR